MLLSPSYTCVTIHENAKRKRGNEKVEKRNHRKGKARRESFAFSEASHYKDGFES